MPTRTVDDPLLVTALLDREGFNRLDGLRRRHFPPHLNRVPAHISLFHHLPGASVDRVVETATDQCRGESPFDLAPLGLRFLGRGVAIAYEGGRLNSLHATLARSWAEWLTPQDRQPFKPHVTIQNKVSPEAARSLYVAMATDPLPVCHVEGLAIWRYLGGPWEAVTTCPFGGGAQ